MNIGVLVDFKQVEGFDEQVAQLRKYGVDYCQLCSWAPELWTDENAALIMDIMKKYGITISAFWCGWEGPQAWNFYEGQLLLGLVPAEYRMARMKNLCDGADFAKKLGVTDVVTHMGFIPENPYDPNFTPLCAAIRYVAEHLKKNDQYLLFETGQETPVTMLRCFEVIGTDNLGVNLDTANLILYGKGNPVDALDVIGKYVRNIHAKDGHYPVNGHELGEETPVGQGKVDFKAFLAGLKALGYDGHLTIEREISGEQQAKDILESKALLESIYAEVYGG